MAKKPEVQYVYYTDGSAARALEPAILPSPRRNRSRRQNPQVQEQQVIEIEVLPIVCIAVCAVMLAPKFGIVGIAFSCVIGWSLMLLFEVPYYWITCRKRQL